jgi:hypothetical protein
VKVGSLDRRLHAPQNTALTTLANAQQQCNGTAEKRSYTEQQRKLLLSWGDIPLYRRYFLKKAGYWWRLVTFGGILD